MSDEATTVLVEQINSALHKLERGPQGVHAGCVTHEAVVTGVTVLLRCERARLRTQIRLLSMVSIGGGIGGFAAGFLLHVAGKWFGM